MKAILLPNPDFLRWAMLAIAGAHKAIVIVNYLAALDEGDRSGAVALIVVALKDAVKRGAAVTVTLEGSKFRENYPFYQRLKDGGADVWMDTSLTFIHTKAILVDESVLCVGSHNLSASALTRHEEMSLATDDAGAIALFKAELAKMTAQRRRIGSDVCREGAAVSMPHLIKLKRALNPHAYLSYLLRAGPVVRRHGGVERSPRGVVLPLSFRKFAWHHRLSVGAIHMYLAGESERLTSPFAPWWRMRRDDIAAKYGFQKQLVNRAQVELRRFGLLEVLTETGEATPAGRPTRYMNYFRQNPFYDYDARVAEIAALTAKFPPKVASAALRLAALVHEDSDAEKIETLCHAIAAAGLPRAASTARTISSLSANSTKRAFGYVEEMLAGNR